MEYTTIRSFRPVESKEDNTDQDRTVMRLCEGLLAVPVGALCTGPAWKALWGTSGLAASIATALSGANPTKAHFVTIARGNHVIVVVWSLSLSLPLGMAYVTTGATDVDYDSTSGVTITATDNAVFRDKDGSAPWFASRIGDRVYFGNGIDDNVQWKTGALVALGPSGPPADIYNHSKVKIPPCTSFVMAAATKSIFAAGNAATPKRVWITSAPTQGFPFNEGVSSTTKSYIDITYSEATKVTALSAYQNYVTAHTDAKPVNLYDVDGTNDGWKCVQAQGMANSSAPAPSAVRDTLGLASFYLGADGEVYKDEAVRVGPADKRAGREQEIATNLGDRDWNRDMKKPVTLGRVSTAYDRKTAIFWIFAEHATFANRMCLWAFNERNKSMTGPIRYPNALVSAVISDSTDGVVMAIMTATGELLYADLADIGETEEFLAEDASTPLGASFAEVGAAPSPTIGQGYVAMTADLATIAEVLSGSQVAMATPWSPFTSGGSYTFTKFWKDAYVAKLETGYLDMNDGNMIKNFLELRMTWQKHSRAYVGIYAMTEGARAGGRFYGLVFAKESQTVILNLSGRRLRLRLVIVAFNSAKALLRELSIGWQPQGKI